MILLTSLLNNSSSGPGDPIPHPLFVICPLTKEENERGEALLFFWSRVLYISSWLQTYSVAEDDLKDDLELPPTSPSYLSLRCAMITGMCYQAQFYAVLGIEPRVNVTLLTELHPQPRGYY